MLSKSVGGQLAAATGASLARDAQSEGAYFGQLCVSFRAWCCGHLTGGPSFETSCFLDARDFVLDEIPRGALSACCGMARIFLCPVPKLCFNKLIYLMYTFQISN